MDANGLCVWTQDESDDMDWVRSEGPTPSSSTGPGGDHTSGDGKQSCILLPIRTSTNQTTTHLPTNVPIYLPTYPSTHQRTHLPTNVPIDPAI